jgi:hypothetical protein
LRERREVHQNEIISILLVSFDPRQCVLWGQRLPI